MYLFFEILLHLHNIEIEKKNREKQKQDRERKIQEEKIIRVVEEYSNEDNIRKGYKGLAGLIKAGILNLENDQIVEVIQRLEMIGIENLGNLYPLQRYKDMIKPDDIKEFLIEFNKLPFEKRNDHILKDIINALNKK